MARVRVQALRVTVLRKGRREDRFEVHADPRNPDDLHLILTNWLEANKWHRSRWGEFQLNARDVGSGPRVNVTIRAA